MKETPIAVEVAVVVTTEVETTVIQIVATPIRTTDLNVSITRTDQTDQTGTLTAGTTDRLTKADLITTVGEVKEGVGAGVAEVVGEVVIKVGAREAEVRVRATGTSESGVTALTTMPQRSSR